MKNTINILKCKNSLHKISSESTLPTSKDGITIFKSKKEYSALFQKTSKQNSVKIVDYPTCLSLTLANKKLSKKKEDIKKFNKINNEKNSYILKYKYKPNSKFKLYLNNSSHSTISQEKVNIKKNKDFPLIKNTLNSTNISILNSSNSQIFNSSILKKIKNKNTTSLRNLFISSIKKNNNKEKNMIFKDKSKGTDIYNLEKKKFEENNNIKLKLKLNNSSMISNDFDTNNFRIKKQENQNEKINNVIILDKQNSEKNLLLQKKKYIKNEIINRDNINKYDINLDSFRNNKNNIDENINITQSKRNNVFNLNNIYKGNIALMKNNIINNINNNKNDNILIKTKKNLRNINEQKYLNIKNNNENKKQRINKEKFELIKKNIMSRINDINKKIKNEKKKNIINKNSLINEKNIIIKKNSISNINNNNGRMIESKKNSLKSSIISNNTTSINNISKIENNVPKNLIFDIKAEEDIINNDEKNNNSIIKNVYKNIEKENKNHKKKVCFSTTEITFVKVKNDNSKINGKNSINSSNFNLLSSDSNSQKEKEFKKKIFERSSIRKISKKDTINLTKKLLVENKKEKLKLLKIFIKKNKSSLIIKKCPKLTQQKKKFLNEIYDDLNKKIINKNNNNILNEKARFLKKNQDIINSKYNINYKNIIDKLEKKIEEINHFENIKLLKEIFELKNNIEIFYFQYKFKFTCNIDYNLSYYIFGNIEFKGVLRNNSDLNYSSYNDINKKNTRRKSVISFLSIENHNLVISNIDKFIIDKTNIIGTDQEDEYWKKRKFNFMTFHNYILKSLPWVKNECSLIKPINSKKFEAFKRNVHISNVRNTLHVSKRKIIGIKKLSDSNNEINIINLNRNNLRKKTIVLFEGPNLDFINSIKKKKKKNIDQISILKKKQFFYRKNENEHNVTQKDSLFLFEEENNEITNDKNDLNSSNFLEHAKKIDDIYFGLSLLIAEGKEFSFRKYFNKYEKIIDINFPIYEGNTLLIMSTKEGLPGITKFLCEKKADVNVKNDLGNTALHYAIGQKFYKLVDILTVFGAREDILNNKGLSPWDCN